MQDSIPDLIRKARKAAGFRSQRALAEAMGVSPLTVLNWEKGHHAPDERHVPRLAELLGLQPGDLAPPPPTPDERQDWRDRISHLEEAVRVYELAVSTLEEAVTLLQARELTLRHEVREQADSLAKLLAARDAKDHR